MAHIHLRIAALILALASHAASAQATIDSATRSELVTAREAVWRAYFKGDSAALVQLLPERMIAMGRDRAAIIHDAKSFVAEGGRFQRMDFTDDEFFLNGDTAIIWSHYVAHLEDADGKPNVMRGRAIELFVKLGGRWINPHWHLDFEK